MSWSVNPFEGEPPTGKPCAGDPPARFGGRGGRNKTALPTPILWRSSRAYSGCHCRRSLRDRRVMTAGRVERGVRSRSDRRHFGGRHARTADAMVADRSAIGASRPSRATPPTPSAWARMPPSQPPAARQRWARAADHRRIPRRWHVHHIRRASGYNACPSRLNHEAEKVEPSARWSFLQHPLDSEIQSR